MYTQDTPSKDPFFVSLQETPLKNPHLEWEFRRVQLCESIRVPAGQGCKWKRGGNSLPTHISLCRARGLQGWALSRQEQLKNFSAKDVLLNKTLACHKHDLSLEFVIGSNFGAGKDFSSKEQDLPWQRWQRHLWVAPCPDIEPCGRGGINWCSISLRCGRLTFKFLL